MPTPSPRYESVYIEADNYNETVHTLLAFAATVCHDGRRREPGSEFGIGRGMETSIDNPVSPSTSITPDLVVQKTTAYGVVAEVKKSLPQDRALWSITRDQLRKYDDTLTGWWSAGEQIATSDAVLLVHQSRGRAFKGYLEEAQRVDPTSVGPFSVIIEFNRSNEAAPFIFFRREWGTIRDSELAEKLEEGVPIPVERVLLSFPSLKFYDAKPPLEHLLSILWIDSFASRAAIAPNDGSPIREFVVSVQEITDELQRGYGSQAIRSDPRSPEFPQPDWVREALDCFVRIRLASPGTAAGTYTIRWRPFRGDLTQRFVRLVDQAGGPLRTVDTQLALPLPPPGSVAEA